ncbi:arginine repressor, partial [Streptococcus agalactiae]
MNKIERQKRIKRLIQSGQIGTQEEIKLHLKNEGIDVTQATLSRDLREIGLLKLRSPEGKLYYSLSTATSNRF